VILDIDYCYCVGIIDYLCLWFPTFRDKIAWHLKVGPIGCSDTSVTNYQSTLRNISEQRRFQSRCRWCVRWIRGTYLPTYLAIYLPAYVPYLFANQPANQPTDRPPARPPACLHTYMPTYLPACLPACLLTYLPTRPHIVINRNITACIFANGKTSNLVYDDDILWQWPPLLVSYESMEAYLC
jgi:hypothetical protein